MSRRIVFGCHGAPYWGSANAWAYNLFEQMQRDGLGVVHVNLLSEADVFFFRYACGEDFDNPRRLEDVHSCTIEPDHAGPQESLQELIRELAPDLLVAWDIAAAVLFRAAAPARPVVYVATRCAHLERLIEDGAVRDASSFQRAVTRGIRFPPEAKSPEYAVRECDLLITASAAVGSALDHFLAKRGQIYAHNPSAADLVYAEAEQFAGLRRPFADRDVDVLFLDDDWRPRVKNLDLVRRIAAQRDGWRVRVVGEHHQPVRGALLEGLPRRRSDLYELLGRTKVLVCGALSDVGPGALFEASAMGCNVVASANSGYAELCNDTLRAGDGRPSEFVERVRSAVARPLGDNRAKFAGTTADLVETLLVF